MQCGHCNSATTSSPTSLTISHSPPAAEAQEGLGDIKPGLQSPALSTVSTADGENDSDDLESSPAPPSLPAPKLPERASAILRASTFGLEYDEDSTRGDEEDEEDQFGTASWGSPYPRTDANLRRRSFSSEGSDDYPVHQLDINTPFLRPPPALQQQVSQPEPQSAVSAAAAVLANRVRRQPLGLTEGWIRTHTAADQTTAEPRHWLSEGSSSEHSSLSGSESGWFHERDPRTPRQGTQTKPKKSKKRSKSRHPRTKSSNETLKADESLHAELDKMSKGLVAEAEPAGDDFLADFSSQSVTPDENQAPQPLPKDMEMSIGKPKIPATPMKITDKPLPRDPPITPRIKKKVPWKGKNIMILLPRDDERGGPGKAPIPLAQDEIARMFESWRELGYNIDGFDLLVEGVVTASSDSQTRDLWPSAEDLAAERRDKPITINLPDLNAWKNYVQELQEAKLRALGVSFGEEAEPEPVSLQSSRMPSAQYPPLPFSPPLPTSSASSNHAIPGFPFPQQFMPGGISATQSPGLPNGASPSPFGVPGKFNTRQSISFPANSSPYQQPPHGWPLPGIGLHDSPSLMNMGGLMSPHSPYGVDGYQPTGSPAFNVHQRHQSLQYLPQHQQMARASPRLHDVREDEEEEEEVEEHVHESVAKSPEPMQRNADQLQAEIDDAEYHLEEQLRNTYEHEDYNPQTQPELIHDMRFTAHMRQTSGFAAVDPYPNEPSEPPLVLHHPRPHSRGHSLSQNFFRDQAPDSLEAAGMPPFAPLNDIPEVQQVDDSCEIQTNPSNLGTPVHDIEFATFQHQKTLSTTSNPWQDVRSGVSSARHSSHGSKPSFSKLKADAPEFKFNPTSSFTPGQFSFSANSFQPAAVQANPASIPKTVFNPTAQFTPSKINPEAAVFAPGQSEFKFNSPGPKFYPEASPFVPGQATQNIVVSSGPAGKGLPRRTDSIFGNIQIENLGTTQKSKAVPIRQPSTSPSQHSDEEDQDSDSNADKHFAETTRAKRAKSAAPDGDDVPLFAERPTEAVVVNIEELAAKETQSPLDDISVEADQTQPHDTSFSSVVSEQMDTQATTAAPSETSPEVRATQKFASVEFESQDNENDNANDIPAFVPESTSASFLEPPRSPSKRTTEDTVESPADSSETASIAARKILTPKGLSSSRFASPPPKPKGLAGSRFASVPVDEVIESVERDEEPVPSAAQIPQAESEPEAPARPAEEQTFDEIDEIMQRMEVNHSMGINKSADALKYPLPSDELTPTVPDELQAPVQLSRDGQSLTPRQFSVHPDPSKPILSTELQDPFVDPPLSSRSFDRGNDSAGEIGSEIATDWEGVFSEEEHSKLQNRAQFFDYRVNEILSGLLASRLGPMQETLSHISQAVANKSNRAPSSRRDMRSASTEFQESDADDEDDEPLPRRSLSPKRDRKMDYIRSVVMEAMVAHHRSQPVLNVSAPETALEESVLLKSLEEIKEQLAANAKGPQPADVNAPVEEISEPKVDDELAAKLIEFQSKSMELEQKLHFEQDRVEREAADRRAAEDHAAEMQRKLQVAETRVEVEVINRTVSDQRVADLEERSRAHDEQMEREVQTRRAAEDRLSEVQRLLRIASEEEDRLRAIVDERDEHIKTLEQSASKAALKMATLDAARDNWTQSQTEMTNRVSYLEEDLRNVRQDNDRWRSEAERADESSRRNAGELAFTVEENKRLQRSLDNIASQLGENERLRESWRAKFLSLQEDMALAAREVAEENAGHIKRDQAMVARQEVLEARLQAEAKTRERLEIEMERLQDNERTGMRAVAECKRLEAMLTELRAENSKLQQSSARYQREFEEARESGASEVKRTRIALQTEVDSANNQVNVIREELEEQNSKLRAELDSVKLSMDTSKAQNEMLLEDAQNSKAKELEELKRKHQNELEDLQTRYERKLNNATEDGQRAEQHLLERLSLSTSKTEHLQDRILHLEDKLEITKQAAAAAAQAAKSAGVDSGSSSLSLSQPKAGLRSELPEKISPQALRESIMVLQEQLQAREQRIEELEQNVADLDPDAASKISKRDDEISWLRELLAVRHGDLQDIILALSQENLDRVAVKDAAIRLKANLQMEEQERERAMNGGSAISLPNIAQTIQAATPRVAQTIGPLAAAWGNWRKGSQSSFRGLSGVLSTAAPGASANNTTPSKSRNNSVQPNGMLGGLLTPPASGVRQSSVADNRPQPTAFSSTGRRFTNQSIASSRSRGESHSSSRPENIASLGSPRRQESKDDPMTPPMTGYDSDAQPGDFDDNDFFEED